MDCVSEDKALFVQRISEALVECGAHRYDYLAKSPLVYEKSEDGTQEYVYVSGIPYRRASVAIDSLPAMLSDIYKAGLI